MENSHNRDTATMVTCKGDARFNAYPAEHTFFRNLTVTFVLLALLMICTTKPLWGQSDGDIYKTEIFRSIEAPRDRKSTRLNSSHVAISYAVFCLKKNSSCRSIRYV